MIALKGAGIRRGERWIFRGLDLALAPGRCVAVLGPNGRGKTTLIKAVTGLDKLDEGTREAPPLVAYVPQVIAPLPYRALDVVVMARARSLGLFERRAAPTTTSPAQRWHASAPRPSPSSGSTGSRAASASSCCWRAP